jgi:hypothetical protein
MQAKLRSSGRIGLVGCEPPQPTRDGSPGTMTSATASLPAPTAHWGVASGKAALFDSAMRRFESSRPLQFDFRVFSNSGRGVKRQRPRRLTLGLAVAVLFGRHPAQDAAANRQGASCVALRDPHRTTASSRSRRRWSLYPIAAPAVGRADRLGLGRSAGSASGARARRPHWADPTTLDFVRGIAERGALAPLFVLITARPEFRAFQGQEAMPGTIQRRIDPTHAKFVVASKKPGSLAASGFGSRMVPCSAHNRVYL